MIVKDMNNKGFMLVETLIVTVMVSTFLVLAYFNYTSSITDEKERLNYDDVSDLYTTKYINDFIIDNNLFTIATDSVLYQNDGEYYFAMHSFGVATLQEKINEFKAKELNATISSEETEILKTYESNIGELAKIIDFYDVKQIVYFNIHPEIFTFCTDEIVYGSYSYNEKSNNYSINRLSNTLVPPSMVVSPINECDNFIGIDPLFLNFLRTVPSQVVDFKEDEFFVAIKYEEEINGKNEVSYAWIPSGVNFVTGSDF